MGVFYINKTGHWFVDSSRLVTDAHAFVGLACLLRDHPEATLKTTPRGTTRYLGLVGRAAAGGLLNLKDKSLWLSPSISQIFKDPNKLANEIFLKRFKNQCNVSNGNVYDDYYGAGNL